ncbi:RDD family protein [Kiloniella majae]|uniref:RDD family protein n=1 Tax=Kiloniella majae TaxID=1938558 RepID=UPI000A27811C|nr:RDD family protein [Kiloniella majae]
MQQTVTPPPARPSPGQASGPSKKQVKAVKFRKEKSPSKEKSHWRRVITPEGVPVSFQLASRGDRLAAVLLDLMIVYGLPLLIILGFLFSGVWENLLDKEETLYVLFSFVTVLLFLWYNFYFSFFEIKWQGRTPGKRALGIRVVDRHGGQLKPDAVFARNLMRELELFLPISMLFSPFASGYDGLIDLLIWVWLGVFIFLPFFNKDRLRAGDMIAGTWVVKIPKTNLLGDIVQDKDTLGSRMKNLSAKTGQEELYSFSDEQVDAYGIYELQTLEELLRKPEVAPKTIKEVTERIKAKIKWVEPPKTETSSFYWKGHKAGSTQSDKAFLKAYYTALRKRLEAKMLFGVRRENKHDK